MSKLHAFSQDAFAFSTLAAPAVPSTAKGCANLRASQWLAVLGVFSALSLFTGCSTFTPNLGVAPSQSSSVSVLNPAGAPAGSGPITLTVNGAGFVSGSTVLWNEQPRTTTFVSSSQLTAEIPASDLANPATVAVGVMSPGKVDQTTAGNNLSNFLPFIVGAGINPVPVISSLSPSSTTAGGQAFLLTVNGTQFLPNSIVKWNGQSRTTHPISTTLVSAEISAADIAAVPGTQPQVSVFNPAPGGGTSNSLGFTITSTQAAVIPASVDNSFGAGAQHSPAIGSSPRFVAYVAASSGGDASVDEVFRQDTCQGVADGCTPQTILISAPLFGLVPDGPSRSPAISADGRFVTFVSDATNLVAGDNNGLADIFLRDTCTGAAADCVPAMTRVSVALNGTEANGASISSSISADGRYVAFDSTATNLVLDNFWNLPPGSTASFIRDTCFGAPAGCKPSTTRLVITNPQSQ